MSNGSARLGGHPVEVVHISCETSGRAGLWPRPPDREVRPRHRPALSAAGVGVMRARGGFSRPCICRHSRRGQEPALAREPKKKSDRGAGAPPEGPGGGTTFGSRASGTLTRFDCRSFSLRFCVGAVGSAAGVSPLWTELSGAGKLASSQVPGRMPSMRRARRRRLTGWHLTDVAEWFPKFRGGGPRRPRRTTPCSTARPWRSARIAIAISRN